MGDDEGAVEEIRDGCSDIETIHHGQIRAASGEICGGRGMRGGGEYGRELYREATDGYPL